MDQIFTHDLSTLHEDLPSIEQSIFSWKHRRVTLRYIKKKERTEPLYNTPHTNPTYMQITLVPLNYRIHDLRKLNT
jgi:hypothetical protein